jgi:uncharacterized membrane protein YdbT with pleckstrin-like domain
VTFSPKLLNEGEDVVLALNEHWITFLKSGAILVVTLVLGVWLLSVTDNGPVLAGSGILVLIALGWFAVTYARWVTTDFVITTDRLIYRHGLIAKHGVEIPLERVNTVFFHQSIFERMVGAGDLVIESAGERGEQAFSNVRRPSAVQNEIYKQMEANENRKFDRITLNNSVPESIPDQIAKLDQLRQQGILTQAEFDQKKQHLLDDVSFFSTKPKTSASSF